MKKYKCDIIDFISNNNKLYDVIVNLTITNLSYQKINIC